jgi:hypothetical protein
MPYPKDVANARSAGNVLAISGSIADLLSQAVDGGLEDMGIAPVFTSPHLGQKILMRHNTARMARQQAQDSVFSGGKRNLLSA